MKNDQEIIKRIREFNRFYTNIIGVVDKHILKSNYTLTEVRIMYEIYFTENCTAKRIKSYLNIDWGHLSRIITNFVKQGIVNKTLSKEDKRLSILTLTKKGKEIFLKLNQNSEDEISNLISKLSSKEKEKLIKMMSDIQLILTK